MSLRSTPFFLSLIFASTLALAEAPAHADGMRLEDAVRLALQNNERAKKAPLRVEAADAQLERARDAFLPTLTATGASTYRPGTPATASALTTSGALVLSQPILQPSAFPQYGAQKHSLEAEKWGAKQDVRQLAFDTAKAFVQALTAEQVLASAQRKLEIAQRNVEDSRARSEAGLTSSNDVTRAELQLATSRGQVATAEGNVKRAYVALSFLTREPVAPPLAPPDRTTRAAQHYEDASANQVKTALDRRANALKAAEERRPDVRSLHERTESLRSSAREPLYRLAPTVNASGQLRFVPNPLPNEKGVDEQVGVNLSWQLFDAGFRYADRRQRLAQADSAELDESLLRRSVKNDVELALATLRASRKNFEAASEAATIAQKNTEETTILYKQGLAKAIELSDANDRQFDADVTRASAKLTMEQAYLDLRNSLGFSPIDEADKSANATPNVDPNASPGASAKETP